MCRKHKDAGLLLVRTVTGEERGHMGFTIEDMLTVSRDKYRMEMAAGKAGWSNSISWILLIEDSMVLRNFKGKDLAVTTGLGFDTEEKLLRLVENLVQIHASGLIVNTGQYVREIPPAVARCCDENDFPLLTVPWSTQLYDMIKDLSVRVLLQGAADEQISNALIHAIEEPETMGLYEKDLLPYFDVDGTFQIVLISTGDLDTMDTVERRRLSYRLQIYLENITHNAHFFYYDSCFTLVVNALSEKQVKEIMEGFIRRVKQKMPSEHVSVGVGSVVTDITNLRLGYKRARAAVNMALRTGRDILCFDEMGIYRLFSRTEDLRLLREMGEDTLRPLLEHDSRHKTSYVETLQRYLESNGSIQSVAESMFTHRNTVIYRINSIKKLLGSGLDTAQERLKYQIACLILKM